MTRMSQTLCSLGPESIPQEIARQLRGGMFQAFAQYWDTFLRSPQFLESAKQCMDNAVAVRKMGSDLLTNFHNEMQAASRDDIDSVMLTVRHMEQRLLDRIDKMAQQVDRLEEQLAGSNGNGFAHRSKRSKPPRAAKGRRSKPNR